MRLQFLYLAVFIFLSSCRFGEPSITIVVESIPPYNTSKTAIYMSGNFNDWNPKDENYRLNWLGGEKFGLELNVPESFTDSLIEYKYTRGSWANVEVSKEGKDISNRKLPNLEKSITALDRIESWEKIESDSIISSDVKIIKEK